MPPSPALRYSPGRDGRVDSHKRGRSLEGALLFKEKDDDLALFSEMQSKERENFLLQSSDDFDDTFSTKLRHFSDFKLGISIPARGESSELLNADGEKNDYDWLLTPPDTPLFPSLDDELPPVNAVSRGRPRSQPISISRSSTMEKSYRSSRGSASPNRLSPSPRSVTSTLQSRGRPSSAPQTSPTHSQRPATPSRRPSPPPSKTSSPAPRSSTPTPRRASTGSGTRGTSPIRTSRGNSASPKIRAWQSNIPGFSSEVPPNLRTSLADRPASYVRGSSPASRNGRDSSSKFGRQSMSPTASRSVSSSHSQERDRISSYSKGSVASSGDDDVDSLQSIHVGNVDRLALKRIGGLPSNRAPAFSKKSSRIVSPSSAPKRSFDSALRQMDHRKSPQNMFRPLLSSVPSTTFYVGKGSSVQRSFVSRNSSVTTSSTASSDQATSGLLDTEESDQHQEDMTTESRNIVYPDVQEEVFAFDKVDALDKEGCNNADDGSLPCELSDFDRDPAIECEPGDSDEFTRPDIEMEFSPSDTLCVRADGSEVARLDDTKVCSRCGCRYHACETLEKDVDLCPDCCRQDDHLAANTHEITALAADKFRTPSMKIIEEYKPLASDENDSHVSLLESPEQVRDVELKLDGVEAVVSEDDNRVKQGQTLFHEQSRTFSQENSLSGTLVKGDEQEATNQQGIDCILPNEDAENPQLTHPDEYSSLKAGISEGAGISILLRRSSSSKGPVIQSRSFVASGITYDDLSCARNSSNSFRSSMGHSSTSASSSVDFTPGRQAETRVRRQLSCGRSDIENYRCDTVTRPQSTGSSLSGSLNDSHHALGRGSRTREENIDGFDGNMKVDRVEESTVGYQGKVIASENQDMDGSLMSFTGEAVPEDHLSMQHEDIRTTGYLMLEENSAISNLENCLACENEEDFLNNAKTVSDIEASDNHQEFGVETEPNIPTTSLDGLGTAEVPTHSRLASISEIEAEDYYHSNPGSESEDMSPTSKSTNEFQEPSVPTPAEKDVAASLLEHNTSDPVHGIAEESTVMVDCRGGSKGRSLTLEEATDTILFCSSIVHDLAYQAATIAMEKERSLPLEGSQPTVTVLGKSTADRKDSRGRTTGKRSSKPQKVRQRRVETDAKAPSTKTENDENANEGMVRNVGLPKEMDSTKPPKLESKCNCSIM